jgi:hypothetical protein
MPGFPFDQNLVRSVLADPLFQRSGVYTGEDNGLHYAVADPRRRTVNVWRKNRYLFGIADLFSLSDYGKGAHYRLTAIAGNHAFFTNGPMMSPPPSWILPYWIRLAKSLWPSGPPFSTIRWVPMNAVYSGGQLLDSGLPSSGGGGYFARTGVGQFRSYVIAPMPAPGLALPAGALEGIFGLSLIVLGGAIVNGPALAHVQDREGVAVWAKVPLTPPLPTNEWETETPYLPATERPDQRPPGPLDGVIVAAASDLSFWNVRIARALITVGASDAVATDPSDSVVCGVKSSLDIQCDYIKDLIQEFGLAID